MAESVFRSGNTILSDPALIKKELTSCEKSRIVETSWEWKAKS